MVEIILDVGRICDALDMPDKQLFYIAVKVPHKIA